LTDRKKMSMVSDFRQTESVAAAAEELLKKRKPAEKKLLTGIGGWVRMLILLQRTGRKLGL